MNVLISAHTDGRIIAEIMRRVGIGSVEGSSTRGGAEAMLRMVDRLKAGEHISITPDGPRGPRHKLKDGVLKLAQLSGSPVYPVGYSVSKSWTVKSWDQMIIPKPFAVVSLFIGEPYYVASELSKDELSQKVLEFEAKLNAIDSRINERVIFAAGTS